MQYRLWLIVFFGIIVTPYSLAAPLPATLNEWLARQQQYDAQLQHTPAPRLRPRLVQIQLETEKAASTQNVMPLGEATRLNINTAGVDEITAKLDGIGRKKAQAIVDYRQQNGGFKSIDDVLNVKGIGEKTLAKNRDKISIR